jgi:CBS domain-containing protein
MQLLHSLSLRELVGQELVAGHPGLTVSEALTLAADNELHHIPVMDGERLAGFVCTCDLRAATPSASLSDVMRTSVLTLDVDSTARDAATLMSENAVGSVIIVEQGRPVGIVTRGDLVARWPDSDELARCECCGLARHLSTNRFGQVLCVYCHERSEADDWFELGGAG